MKREIKFRGYNLKNNMWIYGYYLVNRGKHYIVQDEVVEPFKEASDFEVDAESVGQCVGQYNGECIFEGDIVRVNETDGWKTEYRGVVTYEIQNCRFIVKCDNWKIPITGEKQTDQVGMGGYCEFFYQYKVIGNKFEAYINHLHLQIKNEKTHLEEVAFFDVKQQDISTP